MKTGEEKMSMKIKRKIHPLWRQLGSQKLSMCHIGKYQYVYSSEKGKISLIELPNYFGDGVTWWEIYSLEGGLFEDVEKFNSKEEAEVRIQELLVK